MEEEDFSKLPISDKITHKLWKARVEGYEELSIEFQKMDPDSQASEFRQYSSNLLQMAKDPNLVAQEAGLKCILSYIENAPKSYRQREELVPIIIQKTLGSTRQGTKSKSIEILLMLTEVDIGEPIIDLILPELSSKQPKVVTGCIAVLKEIVLQFGVRAVNIKGALKSIGKMFAHSDKNVRAEASELVLAIYPWLKKDIDPFLVDLKPVQIKELTAKFEEISKTKPNAPRLLRSQEKRIPKTADKEEEEGDSKEEIQENSVQVDLDSYEMSDQVDIFSKITDNFYTKLASKKWKERKEVLDELKPLVSAARLSPFGPYSELVNALAGHINDINIIVGTLAVNCLESIARGLRKDFAQFKNIVVPPLIEKLKEKKQTLVDSLRRCLDAIFSSITLVDVLEDILSAFAHKNPQIRVEAIRWLTRIFQTIKTAPSKAEVKRICDELIKTYQDGDPAVREASAESLGTLMKCVGEKAVTLFIESLDTIKISKVKDYFSRAQVQIKQAVPPKSTLSKPITKKPTLSLGKKSATKTKPPNDTGLEKKPIKKLLKLAAPIKSSLALSSSPTKKIINGTKISIKKPIASGKTKEINITFKIKSEDVDDLIVNALPSPVLENLQSSAWKSRLEAMEGFLTQVEASSSDDIEPELLIRQLAKKPSFKEANFQVMLKMFVCFQTLCSNNPKFSYGCAVLCIPTLVDKLGDIKLRKSAGDCLEAFAERLSMRFVLEQCYPLINAIKSPKIQGDALVWVKQCINAFGITGVPMRPLIDFAIVPLGSSNATVRSNAVKLLGELRVYVGPEIMKFIQDLNPSLLSTIEEEFAKVGDRRPPTPTKSETSTRNSFHKKETVKEDSAKELESDDDTLMEDVFPRVDISLQINPQLLGLLDNSNWKMRKEGLDSIANILEISNKKIKPTLGELLPALKGRLSDVNKNLVISALYLCGNIATAVGKPFDKVGQPIVASVCGCLNDLKASVRAAAVKTLSCMADATNYSFMIKSIATSLTPESLNLRKELLAWLNERLAKSKPKLPDTLPLITPLMLCVHDKNSEVRKYAQGCLIIATESLGFETVKEKCLELNPSMQAQVMQIIEVSKPDLDIPSTFPSQKASSQPLRKTESCTSKRSSNTTQMSISAPKTQSSKVSDSVTPKALIITNDSASKKVRLSKEPSNRWVFDSPPSEYIDSLSEACRPHLSLELRRLLFSTSIHREKDYIAGLSLLAKGLTDPYFATEKFGFSQAEYFERCITVSDILFKYVTLKLYEQGMTILLKCVDLLTHLFKVFEKSKLQISETEAYILVPTLSHRLGHTNETLKRRVKDLFKQLCLIFPASKIYNLLANNGLRSKNAKARAETLDELGILIKRHGVSVCSSPAKAFPILAIHVGDRDAGVRNSAITAIANGYIQLGEEIFKYLAGIPDKERGYLEERFKRTKITASPSPAAKPERNQEERDLHMFSFQHSGPTPSGTTRSNVPSDAPSPLKRKVSDNILDDSPEDQLGEDFYQADICSPKSPKRATTESPIFRYGVNSEVDLGDAISRVLGSLVSSNYSVAISGLEEVERLFSGPVDLIKPYTNDILMRVTQMLDNLFSADRNHPPEFSRCLKMLITTLTQVFSNPVLAQAVNSEALSRTIEEVLHRLIDQRGEPTGQSTALSRQLNVLINKILESSSSNVTYHTLLGMIQKSVVTPGVNATDIQSKYAAYLVKCIWRLTRNIRFHLQRQDLDSSRLLFYVNTFFLKYPPSELKRRANKEDGQAQLFLKTCRTVLYELCLVMEDDLLNHFDKLPQNPNEDFVSGLVKQMLLRIKQKDVNVGEKTKRVHSRYEDTQNTDILTPIVTPAMVKLESILAAFSHQRIPQNYLIDLKKFLLVHPHFRADYQTILEKRDESLFIKVNKALEDLDHTGNKIFSDLDDPVKNQPSIVGTIASPPPQEEDIFPPAKKGLTTFKHLELKQIPIFKGEICSKKPSVSSQADDDSPPPSRRPRTVRDLRARLLELRLANGHSDDSSHPDSPSVNK